MEIRRQSSSISVYNRETATINQLALSAFMPGPFGRSHKERSRASLPEPASYSSISMSRSIIAVPPYARQRRNAWDFTRSARPRNRLNLWRAKYGVRSLSELYH